MPQIHYLKSVTSDHDSTDNTLSDSHHLLPLLLAIGQVISSHLIKIKYRKIPFISSQDDKIKCLICHAVYIEPEENCTDGHNLVFHTVEGGFRHSILLNLYLNSIPVSTLHPMKSVL